MAPPTENVLVIGATGVIGRYITNALVNAQPPFKRIGIYTSAATVEHKAAQIQALKEKGVEVFVGDFNDESKILDVYKGLCYPAVCFPFVVSPRNEPIAPAYTSFEKKHNKS